MNTRSHRRLISGAPIEEQVGKEWDPRKSGLPTF